ncbi:ABC transporter permease [Dactylosporangium sp. NPDC051484]|uniref:ABC transporter permease n=1 Tax=Dactylosporangium sp. NPDC051484 TaxID=3154942 RepID=UPI003451064F
MRTVLRWLCGLVPLAVGLIVWELNSTADALSFPAPSSWWTAGKELASKDSLWPALRSTMETFLISMLLATILGVAAGVVIGFTPKLERALTPLIDFFRTLPPPVMVPVLTLLLGITLKASVAIVVLSVVWPILLNTISAVHEMPGIRREVARVFGLGRTEAFFKVTLPSLLPGIVVGLRTALSIGLVVTLLTDMLGSADGIGRLLVIQQQLFLPSAVWALLFVIGALGYLLNLAVQAAASFLLRRHPATQH